eukprot:2423007-Alexandrium_andersonii.AAC.1
MGRSANAAGKPTAAGLSSGAPHASATLLTLLPLRPFPPGASCLLRTPRTSPPEATAARTL